MTETLSSEELHCDEEWEPTHPATTARTWTDAFAWTVLHVARNPVHIDGEPVRLRVAARSTQPDWIGATTRSGPVLGYGYWQLFPADPAKARRQGWIELQLWVKQPWQATRWDTDGTTIDLPEPRTMPAPERRTSPPAKAVPPAVSPALDKALCASGPLPQPDVASAEVELEPDTPAVVRTRASAGAPERSPWRSVGDPGGGG
ncbi:hypothetical protein AB0D33_36240 [Streptomyces sp. NPDC048404]|uniref:hypothetical protein n=1 Tax=unclassified Streptomyces TaxID=2593676 RepID=UPI003440CDF4